MQAIDENDMQKHWRRLKREIKANPKRAALLGALLCAAAYFWGPLVWGWIAPDDGRTVGPSTARSRSSQSKQDDAKTKQAAEPIRPDWRAIRATAEDDPRMAPAEQLTALRDPFHLTEAERLQLAAATPNEEAAAEREKEKAKEPVVPQITSAVEAPPTALVDPQALGVTLRGTIVGHAAMFGGATDSGRTTTVAIGETLMVRAPVVAAPADSAPLSNEATGSTETTRLLRFRLKRVDRDSVALTREGTSYTLKLPANRMADRIYSTGSP